MLKGEREKPFIVQVGSRSNKIVIISEESWALTGCFSLTLTLFGDGIQRRSLPRVSRTKLNSGPSRC